jgi:hypothetical protein
LITAAFSTVIDLDIAMQTFNAQDAVPNLLHRSLKAFAGKKGQVGAIENAGVGVLPIILEK